MKEFVPGYGHPKGSLIRLPSFGITLAAGITVPTDGTTGYAPGCIFQHVDGGNNTALYVNEGTNTSCDFNLVTIDAGIDLTGLTATVAELNGLDADLATNILAAGAGVSAAETYKTGIARQGSLIITRIMVDLTGLVASNTDLDIIGNTGGATSAHFGQITVAKSGTLAGGRVTCLEVPAGGPDDIDFYSATVSTGAQDVDVTTLTETALITSGGAWASGTTKGMTALPPANDYLYICCGEASGGTMSAGKFLIELFGS